MYKIDTFGEVSEWLKEHAWKACVSVPGTEGSNPSLSATRRTLGQSVADAEAGPVPGKERRSNRVRPGTEQP